MLFTTKNPKTNNSFFNFNLILVKHEYEEVGYIIQYSRTTYNRYGGTNGWEVIQFVPKKGYEEYSLQRKSSKLYEDIRPYENLKVRQWFHLGARDGVEEKLFFVKEIQPIEVSLVDATTCPGLWQEVVGKINLSWDGKSEDVIENNIVITDEYVLLKAGKTSLYYITKDGFKYKYVNKDILEKNFILIKDDLITMIRMSCDEETLEAPDIEEIADEPRPRRPRRTRREE